jgi:hypothetical protein
MGNRNKAIIRRITMNTLKDSEALLTTKHRIGSADFYGGYEPMTARN